MDHASGTIRAAQFQKGWWSRRFTLVSSSSGSSGEVQAVFTLPLHSVVLISWGEFPLEDVTDNF